MDLAGYAALNGPLFHGGADIWGAQTFWGSSALGQAGTLRKSPLVKSSNQH